MQFCMDWVLITFGTQVTNKKQPVWPVFPDYLSVSYDYGQNYFCVTMDNMVKCCCSQEKKNGGF